MTHRAVPRHVHRLAKASSEAVAALQEARRARGLAERVVLPVSVRMRDRVRAEIEGATVTDAVATLAST